MRIYSWNVNGIRAVDRKNALDWFFDGSNRTDEILCLQETKAHPDQLDKKLKERGGYKSYFASAEKKGYSGVAIYTKIEPRKVFYGMGEQRFDKEGRVIGLEFEKFYLLNVYFPNGKMSQERLNYKLDFYENFLNFSNQLRKIKSVIVCGDVNTAHQEKDLARPRANEKISGFLPSERRWIDKFLESGFIDTFRKFNQDKEKYTWWDLKSRARERNVGWRIDYFFVSRDLEVNLKLAEIMTEVYGSDHCPIVIELKF